jgi:hypothetical protein
VKQYFAFPFLAQEEKNYPTYHIRTVVQSVCHNLTLSIVLCGVQVKGCYPGSSHHAVLQTDGKFCLTIVIINAYIAYCNSVDTFK